MVCTGCGIVGADARPNWQEQPPRESLTGVQKVSDERRLGSHRGFVKRFTLVVMINA
jgi:hypothetical protein